MIMVGVGVGESPVVQIRIKYIRAPEGQTENTSWKQSWVNEHLAFTIYK